MRKYIQSFRLYYGKCPMKSLLLYFGVTLGIMLVIILPSAVGIGGGEDFFSGVLEGISSTIGLMISLCSCIFLGGLYSYNQPEAPGYKYFRAIPDDAAAFRRAIVAANVLSLLAGVVMTAVMTAVFLMAGTDISGVLYGVILLPVETGIMNFTGFIMRRNAKFIILMATLCLVGFGSGFIAGFDGDEESTLMETLSADQWIIFLAAGAAVLIFAGGLVFALIMTGRRRGGMSCAE